MTVRETLGPAVAALRAEEARLAFAIGEIEREVEKAADVELTGPIGEVTPALDALTDAVMRLLDLTSLAGADVRGKTHLVNNLLENERLALQYRSRQMVDERRQAEERQARIDEVARAQADNAREAALLAQGDPAAFQKWKARQESAAAG